MVEDLPSRLARNRRTRGKTPCAAYLAFWDPNFAAVSIRSWDPQRTDRPSALPDLIEVRRVFAEPIGAAETIARYTGKLIGQLCEALEAKGLGARRLDLLLYRVDNRIEAIRIGTSLAGARRDAYEPAPLR